MSLTGKTLANTYKDLLHMNSSNTGVGTTLKNVQDGDGNISSLYISDDAVLIKPENDDTTTVVDVQTTDATSVFEVDTTNQLVKASGNYVNTQYAYFGADRVDSAAYTANNHHPIPFTASGNISNPSDIPTFGTGTDPATTFTTAEGNGTRASNLVSTFWYVPDAITIDSVTSFEGADTATGDTTRMHLFSYTFTSGSTSALSSGTLLAHNSDVTNAGSEQAYLSSWTVDSGSVAAGKVILAFFRSDSINSDYSINITVKYHLT